MRKGINANHHFALWSDNMHVLIDCFGLQMKVFGTKIWAGNIDDFKNFWGHSFVMCHFGVTDNAVSID